jgi:tetratricopeptide (TPR) repeat protein
MKKSMIRASIALFVLLALVASDASAQTSRRRPRTISSSGNSSSVRAELAAVLLESGKYSDAAREYRSLLGREPSNYTYRLALARALAWGGSFREAERELTLLGRQRPNDPDLDQLEQLVRPNLEPSSYEASQWVAQRPYYQAYRVALAQALVREHQPRAAITVYDTLLAINPSGTLLRELANAYSDAGDRRGGIARVSEFVARAPADTGYRLALIDLLVEDRQYAAAIAQSDTVLSYGRTPSVLVSRARIDIARDDLGAADRDLLEALAAKPSPQAYLLLGDTYRWRGEYGKARGSYEYARTMRGGRPVTEAFAQLARDERSVLTFEPPSAAEDGWQSTATADGDNGGVHYSTVDFRRGFEFGAGFVGSAGLEVRQLREESATSHGAAGSYATEVGVSREGIAGAFYGRAGATAGFVAQQLAQTVPTGSLALTGRYYAWSGSAELSANPAYPSLRTLASVIPLGQGSKPLTETGAAFSLAGPLGPANLAFGLHRVSISDANQRTEKEAYARLPLNPALSVVYWGSSIAFARPSAMYWSPQDYTSNLLGLELAARQLRGWSVLMRVLPGIASTTDMPFIHSAIADTSAQQQRFQISTGGELAYRRPGWETGIGFDWGRVASYTRTSISARVTLAR